MSTADIIRSLRAVMTKLTKYDHLPELDSIAIHGSEVLLGVAGPWRSWRVLANLAQWADEFKVPITLALSLGGSGDVRTEFSLADQKVRLTEYIGTAQAYQLGGVLGKPLSQAEPIIVTAAELLAALAKLDPAATS